MVSAHRNLLDLARKLDPTAAACITSNLSCSAQMVINGCLPRGMCYRAVAAGLGGLVLVRACGDQRSRDPAVGMPGDVSREMPVINIENSAGSPHWRWTNMGHTVPVNSTPQTARP